MSYPEMEQSLEAALIHDGESNYTLAPEWLSCWITVDSLSVHVQRDGDSLVIEVFPLHQEDEAAMVSDRPTGRAWATPTAIASYQPALFKNSLLSRFQVWYLLRAEQEAVPWVQVEGCYTAVLVCWPDIPRKAMRPSIRQDIGFTDFPLNQICLHVAGGVLYLPYED